MAETVTAAAPSFVLRTLSESATTADRQQVFAFAPATANFLEARAYVRGVELAERRRVVGLLLERLDEFPDVQELWTCWEPQLEVTVVVDERRMDTDLRLHVVFRELAATTHDPAGGDLTIVAAPYEPEAAEKLFSR